MRLQLYFPLAFTFLLFNISLAQPIDTSAVALQAPDTASYWKINGNTAINFSQVSLNNWTGGGESAVAVGSIFAANANYMKGRNIWDNSLEVAYGLNRIGGNENDFRKTDDNFIFMSNYGRRLKKNWLASANLNFRTQMAPGYNYEDGPNGESSRTLISNLFAPAFLQLGIGATYKQGDVFSLTVSPVAGKFTFVMNDSLSNAGAFGVDPGENFRAEFGANVINNINIEIMENVNFRSNLILFSAYNNFEYVDVNWEALLAFKVNKYIATSISTQLIYDDDILIPTDDGGTTKGIQFKSALNIGFSYNF